MRRVGRLFEAIGEAENWKLAWLNAIRGKSRDPFVLEFRRDLEGNLEALRRDFAALSFRFGHYEQFTIRDPKPRLISAAAFPERVAQHALMNILDPVFDTYQIFDSYACRRGKGTEAAILRAFRSVKAKPYFLKMDVRKYFNSIDHGILKAQLRRRIKDDRLLLVLDSIIDSWETEPKRGIPIGNLTSQYFANHYLALLDHWAKEGRGAVHWIRYMDDILACGDDRAFLDDLYDGARDFASSELRLELKPKILDRTRRGAPFLGFLVKPDGIFLAGKSRRRFRKRVREIDYHYAKGDLSERAVADSVTAMCAHTLVARSLSFRYAVFHGRGLGD